LFISPHEVTCEVRKNPLGGSCHGRYHTGRQRGDAAVICQQQEDQLTRLLRARLAADEWEPGQRLPAVAALAADYQAGHGTIRRALGRLQDEGLIVTLPRFGTFRSRRDPAKD
jgi:DNA-binding GntR family transcriptional regulator